MKTRNLVLIISGAVLFLGIAAAGFFLVRSEKMVLRNPMLTQQPSIVTWLEGEVSVSSDPVGSEDWIPAEVGMKLKEGAGIRTGGDSTVDVRLYDEGVIRLQQNTEVRLSDLSLKRQTVEILTGRLFARFRLLFDSQNLQFRTPDAVAAVRGTELIFHVDESGTRIDALSGITEVTSPDHPGERVLLAHQKSTVISTGEPPSHPTDLDPVQVAADRKVFNGINTEKVFLISQDIRFEPNTANILPESVPVLDDVALKLALRREKILIVGHTADVGASGGQIRLSESRAEAIRSQLMDRGISGRRLTTVGYGGSQPVGDNSTADGRAANRRVEFLVVE